MVRNPVTNEVTLSRRDWLSLVAAIAIAVVPQLIGGCIWAAVMYADLCVVKATVQDLKERLIRVEEHGAARDIKPPRTSAILPPIPVKGGT